MIEIFPIIDHSVIIAPSYLHEYFLRKREMNPFVDFKLLSKEDLLKGFFFEIDEKAVQFLMKEENIRYDIAKMYLENMYFLPDSKTENQKIAKLQDIKTKLEKAGLLLRDPYYSRLFDKRQVFVYGYQVDDREIKYVLDSLSISYSTVGLMASKRPLSISHFATIEDEVRFCFNQIAGLVSQGIRIDDICIYDPPSDYDFILPTFSDYFGLPINMPKKTSLYSTRTGLRFIGLLKNGQSPTKALVTISESDDLVAYQIIQQAVSHYSEIGMSAAQIVEYFEKVLKASYLPDETYDHGIKILRSPVAPDNSYVFILGFNEGSFPFTEKDQDYLSDSEKKSLGRVTSTEENTRRTDDLIYLLCSSPHIFLSYKDKSLSDSFFKSPLVNQLGMSIVESPLSDTDYGQTWSAIRLASFLDSRYRYHYENPELKSYQSQLAIPYRKFDYRFKRVSAISEHEQIRYSYSSIKTFYQCQFKYYMEHVLRLDPFEDNFFTKFGKLAHSVLESKYQPNFDFDKSFDEEISKMSFTNKEGTMLVRLREDLRNVVLFNNEHEQNMDLRKVICEYRPTLKLSDDASIVGSIDKVVITGPNQEYISLVDYKTGNDEFNHNLIQFGYSLQLPIYSLLASSDPLLSEKKLIGLYIQKIIPNKLVRPSGKDAVKFYFDQLKLGGISTDNISELITFDKSYMASRFIKAIRVTNDNVFYKNARVASRDVLDGYAQTAKSKIAEADSLIRQNDFKINPKKINSDESSCKYCAFRDICFRKDEDIIILKSSKEADSDGVD